jgi:hypothetical protein
MIGGGGGPMPKIFCNSGLAWGSKEKIGHAIKYDASSSILQPVVPCRRTGILEQYSRRLGILCKLYRLLTPDIAYQAGRAVCKYDANG